MRKSDAFPQPFLKESGFGGTLQIHPVIVRVVLLAKQTGYGPEKHDGLYVFNGRVADAFPHRLIIEFLIFEIFTVGKVDDQVFLQSLEAGEDTGGAIFFLPGRKKCSKIGVVGQDVLLAHKIYGIDDIAFGKAEAVRNVIDPRLGIVF